MNLLSRCYNHCSLIVTHAHFPLQEVVEAMMIASLATLTRGIMTHDEIAAKSNVIYSHNVTNKKIRSLDVFSAFSRNLPI